MIHDPTHLRAAQCDDRNHRGKIMKDLAQKLRDRHYELRESYRHKMNEACDRAQVAAYNDHMDECSIKSTESERYREAFHALNLMEEAIDDVYERALALGPDAAAEESAA
jgi:hypothetical protein